MAELVRHIPQVIQDVNVFVDGTGYLGVAKNLKLPAIEQQMVERKGALEGKYATGILKAMEISFKLNKVDANVFGGFGRNTFENQVPIIFKASVFDKGKTKSLTCTVNGEWESISISELEGGKELEVEAKIAVRFYKLEIGGVSLVNIDTEKLTCEINGIDYYSSLRSNLS